MDDDMILLRWDDARMMSGYGETYFYPDWHRPLACSRG